MSFRGVNDFSELYRAAFAETDIEKKLGLLHEVQRIINCYTMEANEAKDESALELEAA